MHIEVTRDVVNAMEAAARAAHPKEACGILLGDGQGGENRITQFVETRNVHPAPETHFEINPQALIAAHRGARDGGPQVLGYFHSHPAGAAEPSATDQAQASGDGRIWAIWGEGALKFHRDLPSGFEPLPSRVVSG